MTLYRMMYFPQRSWEGQRPRRAHFCWNYLPRRQAALYTWDTLGKKVARSISYVSHCGQTSTSLSQVQHGNKLYQHIWVVQQHTCCTVNLMPYIPILRVFCTHANEVDVAHEVGKPQLPAFYCQQHTPDSAHTLLIHHFLEVPSISHSWSTPVHPQDFQMITGYYGWFSDLEETHLRWSYKEDFSYETAVRPAKHSLMPVLALTGIHILLYATCSKA